MKRGFRDKRGDNAPQTAHYKLYLYILAITSGTAATNLSYVEDSQTYPLDHSVWVGYPQVESIYCLDRTLLYRYSDSTTVSGTFYLLLVLHKYYLHVE